MRDLVECWKKEVLLLHLLHLHKHEWEMYLIRYPVISQRQTFTWFITEIIYFKWTTSYLLFFNLFIAAVTVIKNELNDLYRKYNFVLLYCILLHYFECFNFNERYGKIKTRCIYKKIKWNILSLDEIWKIYTLHFIST